MLYYCSFFLLYIYIYLVYIVTYCYISIYLVYLVYPFDSFQLMTCLPSNFEIFSRLVVWLVAVGSSGWARADALPFSRDFGNRPIPLPTCSSIFWGCVDCELQQC